MSIEWVVGLFLLGIVMLLAEVVLPGGVIGIVGGIMAIVAIVFAFNHGTWVGAGMIAITVFVVPFSFYLALKRLALRRTLAASEGSVVGTEKLTALKGKSGIAATPLHPSGVVVIDGNRVDVLTDGEMIAAGASVTVARVEGNRIYVRESRPGAA
ncbi:MAG: NfeD family protein [Planctomycetota bacterium]|nr:NfeD family protein [Planctomycetota bacterium]